MATATVLTADTVEILRAYGRGMEIRHIAKSTGLPGEQVRTVVSCDAGYDRIHARNLVDQYDTAPPTAAAAAPPDPTDAGAVPAAADTTDPMPEPAPQELETAEDDDASPRTVVLCGSTRFRDLFHAVTRRLTLDGVIVLAPGVFGHADGRQPTAAQKAALDVLHLHKIDRADEVVVVSPGGYLGESTRQEIAYAELLGTPVSYLDGEADLPAGPVPGDPQEGAAHPAPVAGDEAPLRTWGAFLCEACDHTHPTRATCCDRPMTSVYVRLDRRPA